MKDHRLTQADVGVDRSSQADDNTQTQQQGPPIPMLILHASLSQLFAHLQDKRASFYEAESFSILLTKDCWHLIARADVCLQSINEVT